MAVDAQIPVKSIEPTQEEWTEERYIAGLAQLERLQNRIDTLRNAIPSIIHSLATPHPTPRALYTSFKSAAMTSSQNISDLRTEWTTPNVQQVFDKADRSRNETKAEDLDFETLELVETYGWVDKAEDMGVNGFGVKKEEDKVKVEDGIDEKVMTDEEVRGLLEAFKKKHAGGSQNLQINWTTDLNTVNISFTIPGGSLTFAIQRQMRPNKAPTYKVTLPSDNPGFGSPIKNWLAMRPRQTDLQYTLDMVKAYSNSRRAPCVHCNALVKDGGGTSVRMKRVGGNEWIVLHERCRVEGGFGIGG